MPILVAIELASGFIFSEAECENRTYETWWEQVSGWFNREQWDCRCLVSDGAKALVKLAVSGLGCVSLPDVFHLLYALSKSMGTALARQQVKLQKQLHTLEEKLKTNSSDNSVSQVQDQITVLLTQQQILATDHQDYQQSLHALSQAIHPFNLNTGESQFGLELPTGINKTKRPVNHNLNKIITTRLNRRIPVFSQIALPLPTLCPILNNRFGLIGLSGCVLSFNGLLLLLRGVIFICSPSC